MRILFLALAAFAVSGCGGSPMSVHSRTQGPEDYTSEEKRRIKNNTCVFGSERCGFEGKGSAI